ncbi:hypothetical protein [Caudoviricetes sp.]|nr:hypothetical protein [Caudoviricetes sp.]
MERPTTRFSEPPCQSRPTPSLLIPRLIRNPPSLPRSCSACGTTCCRSWASIPRPLRRRSLRRGSCETSRTSPQMGVSLSLAGCRWSLSR